MIDDRTLDQAIVTAHREASLPFRAGKTWEQQSAAWVHQSAVRRALAELWRALKAPAASEHTLSPEVAQKRRENLVAASDADKFAHRGHLQLVPEDPTGRMLAALVGIRDHARDAIEEIDANTEADGEHNYYTRNRAKWQAVLAAIEAAEGAPVA